MIKKKQFSFLVQYKVECTSVKEARGYRWCQRFLKLQILIKVAQNSEGTFENETINQ